MVRGDHSTFSFVTNVMENTGDEDAVTMVGATFTWDSPAGPVLSE